ncbi:MAG: GTPase HflX [Clostridia bacterium]|nr:GTPase HflX [Clostridia bacterium]MBQ1967655.1 GTPase HflX [Clostridia bacterium]MBQ1996247.1 GTPase HflX [Clostridia bacterium]MBQ5904571.1 GTPase HflX [Clostridia bacterium]
MPMYENEIRPERALLVSVDTGDFDAQVSIDELEELASTAGAVTIGQVIQKKEAPEKATFVGVGKLAEIIAFCQSNEVDLLIFDSELSPSQQRNLEKLTGVRVIDRTTLILDIFAQRARSSEGKLQVELAQLRYQLPRLAGQGTSLSRLGGGIGTRGPGETKLESDKRHIRRRIQKLEEDLEAMEKRRHQMRKRREKDSVQTVAIVGYTNAGKSTLMNALTDAGVLAENKLFATLDPTSRALTLPDGRQVMLVDTVGFIRRLPHKLVEAFKSTLEEAASATLVLNVCDASDEHAAEHLEVTQKLLSELGYEDKPIISVMNKCDKVGDIYSMHTFGKTVMISALQQKGFDELLTAILKELPPTRRKVELMLPFSQGAIAARIRNEGAVEEEEYKPEGLYMRAIIDIALISQVEEWLI